MLNLTQAASLNLNLSTPVSRDTLSGFHSVGGASPQALKLPPNRCKPKNEKLGGRYGWRTSTYDFKMY